MSLVLSKAATLKPEIQLAQALSEYEAVLTLDQKQTLRLYRGQSPPNPIDVIRLTAEIDRDAIRLRKSRQCVGPRLTKLLQSVQQFSTVADIIIGGAQSEIAAGIWSVLKMSLIVNNDVSLNHSPWLIERSSDCFYVFLVF